MDSISRKRKTSFSTLKCKGSIDIRCEPQSIIPYDSTFHPSSIKLTAVILKNLINKSQTNESEFEPRAKKHKTCAKPNKKRKNEIKLKLNPENILCSFKNIIKVLNKRRIDKKERQDCAKFIQLVIDRSPITNLFTNQQTSMKQIVSTASQTMDQILQDNSEHNIVSNNEKKWIHINKPSN